MNAKTRKEIPMFRGLLAYFPRALRYVAQVSMAGNNQHHPDKPLHWDKDKSTDEEDALIRHLTDVASGEEMDTDGILHRGKVAWRGLSQLERYLEKLDKI